MSQQAVVWLCHQPTIGNVNGYQPATLAAIVTASRERFPCRVTADPDTDGQLTIVVPPDFPICLRYPRGRLAGTDLDSHEIQQNRIFSSQTDASVFLEPYM